MSETIAAHVKGLFDKGAIGGFVAPARRDGRILPHLFTSAEQLELLYTGAGDGGSPVRYPLNKLLQKLARLDPTVTLAVMVRGCDERGLKELFKWNQLDPERVVPVGLACPQALAESCQCAKPYPDALVEGTLASGVDDETVGAVEALAVTERLTWWMAEFEKCIKCYGCRDGCPMCFCKECSLQEQDYIEGGRVPPDIPLFHLSRAVHMAGRCIDCGLCNEACPADIPLRTLYRKVEAIIDTHYDFRPGISEGKSPLNILGDRPEH